MKTTKFYDPETEKIIDYPITDEAYEYYKENIGDPSEMEFWAGLFGNLTDFSDFPHKDK